MKGCAPELFCCFLLYVFAYVTLFHYRRPAANLAYWCYTGTGPDWAETCLYYGFFPVYFVHARMFDGHRHTWDRSQPVYPANFEG